jgi:hypothetical protein
MEERADRRGRTLPCMPPRSNPPAIRPCRRRRRRRRQRRTESARAAARSGETEREASSFPLSLAFACVFLVAFLESVYTFLASIHTSLASTLPLAPFIISSFPHPSRRFSPPCASNPAHICAREWSRGKPAFRRRWRKRPPTRSAGRRTCGRRRGQSGAGIRGREGGGRACRKNAARAGRRRRGCGPRRRGAASPRRARRPSRLWEGGRM